MVFGFVAARHAARSAPSAPSTGSGPERIDADVKEV
jgi:hypothetical protein